MSNSGIYYGQINTPSIYYGEINIQNVFIGSHPVFKAFSPADEAYTNSLYPDGTSFTPPSAHSS